MPDQPGLAQYACDHCKHRKLRCSREIPICENCKEWSGECVYSRRGKIRRRPRASRVITPNESQPISAPASTARQTDSLSSNDESNDNSEYTDSPGQILNEDSSSPFYLGPSTTATFLSQANSDIDKLRTSLRDPNLQSHAEDSLSELSNAFAAAHFSNTSDVRRSVREFRRKSEVFFIPSQEEGLRLIEIFQQGIVKGSPFFDSAPPALLPKIVFQPSTIQERGWLLLVNAFLSTAMTFINPSNTMLIQGLQRNVWMLIEDSSIFLEPSEISIQALVLLSTHSQEITTPSLCWTLTSHACQMAHTLALHLPTSRAPIGSEAYLQRNCLFWGLFILDKALSLSFGRPPMLPAYLYLNVPPPDPKHLLRSRPHQKSTRNDVTDFGCFFILNFRELALLQGRIGETMHRKLDAVTRAKLRSDLERWMSSVQDKSSLVQEKPPRDPEEDLEIRVGITFLTFQYHHLMIYLTRADKEPCSQAKCLASARAAIPLLENLVSATSQVFNGLVWQLLYQPFMPFFIIFSNIIAHPLAPTSFKDLGLLRNVVLYFLQMYNNHPSSKRLERVAETFTQLAEAYVRRAMSVGKGDGEGTSSAPSFQEQTSNNGNDLINNLNFSPFASTPTLVRTRQPPQTVQKQSVFSPIFNFRPTSSDPVALLNFFSSSSSNSPSDNLSASISDFDSDSSNNISGNTPSTPQLENTNPISPTKPLSPELDAVSFDRMDFSSDPILQQLRDFEQNYGFDTSFDWFSWGEYDCNIG